MTRRADHGQRSGPSAVSPPVVIVDRVGQELLVEPRCVEALAPLRTARHALARSEPGGCRVEAALERLGTVDHHPSGPRTYYPAGLEPIVFRLLHRAGYQVTRTGDRAVILPAPETSDGLGPVDSALLDFVHRHERGLVRYDGHFVNPAQLVAQLRLAYPAAKIAVAVAGREALWAFGRCLKSIIPGATVADDRCQAPAGPLVVATFMGLGADCVDLHRRDIVVVLDASEALGRFARLALPGAPQARLYGLLDRSRRLAPYDRDRVLALFGPEEVVIPWHGYVERPVEVVTCRITGGPAGVLGDDVVALKRGAVWLNPVRNRRLAQLACALSQGDLGRVAAESPALSARPGDGSESRVVVLVENVEHALALAGRLPGWPIVTGPEVVTVGLPPHQIVALEKCRWRGGEPPARAVATFAGLDAAGPVDADVVIRADGGADVPEALAAICITHNHEARSLLLVDPDDRHHPVLRRWGRSRLNAYLARGWAVDGSSSMATDSISRFLGSRPGREP